MCAYTTSATELFSDYLGDFYSRRLLLHTTLYKTSAAAPPAPGNSHGPSEQYTGYNTLDANVVMVLAVLLCAVIFSVGLHSIIRCALRCSSLVASEPAASNPSARLANTGVKRKVLRTFLTVTFSTDLKLPGLDTECVICLSEFTTGDRVRLLPNCNHGFHVRCIDKWLSSHSSCPTCRHCLIETCPKIVGYSQASWSEHPPPVQESIANIAPLQHERFICNYR